MVTNVEYESVPIDTLTINGKENIVKVLSSQQFELPSFESTVEGVAGMLGHIDNTIVQHIVRITSANPAKIKTEYPHGLANGDRIIIIDVEGMTDLNYNLYAVEIIDPSDKYNFNLKQYLDVSLDQSSTEFSAYQRGGRIIKIPQSNSLHNFTKVEAVGVGITESNFSTPSKLLLGIITIFYSKRGKQTW